jgi:class 3 adenylate cyclase/tetratricopeptide (TPR) repeat protein
MRCTNCGSENDAGRKFCLECGTRLNAPCPNCGTPNPPGARFCGECGTQLSEPPSAEPRAGPRPPAEERPAAAQRRLVSVLFADLVGFTPFAEERDPEEVRSVLQRYSDMSRQVVERYGGTVEKFIGDAVMAVWGTPTAHEDDAERAVRAALDLTDLVQTLGPSIQARAGVLTGEAAVTVGATDQGLLAGDLVNTAARLQSVAPAGSVLVGESTMHAASAALAFEPAGDQLLKGKAVPVPAWRALRVVAQRRGAGRTETLETPFVGRDEEFRLLRELLHLGGRDPRARLVSVTGPAGIGKSRLAWELEKYVDGVVEPIYWHHGRCPAYGEGIAFWALGEMVRRRCRLVESDDEAITRERVAAAVAEHVADESERPWIESALLALLGVEQAPQGGREMLFAAWRRFFENIAARGTTVLVFEDLHWADSGLLDFIDHLIDWSKAAPLLVVTLARPELFDRRPNWGAGKRTLTAIQLDPLAADHMRQLLAGLVPALPEPAVRRIIERADGVPLYAVETVRMLLADGRLARVDGAYQPTGELGDLDVPDSLRSLITSRLDALDAADRSLLQDASVLGQSFAIDAVSAVTGTPPADLEPRLRQLVRRDLLTLEADPRSPERGQYGFMQSLTREVAYSTLARPERRTRHIAAARHYEALGGDETAGVLAGHYLAAHETSMPGAEADAVAAQARVALRAAAERSAGLGSHLQAADYLGQALAVTTDRADQAALLERQAMEADLAGRYERAESCARSAIALYGELGDAAGVARTQGVLGTLLIHAQRVGDAIAELEPALAELPEDAAPEVRADVLAKLARAYYRNLEPRRSLEVVEQALDLAERHSLTRTIAEAVVTKGTALTMLSRHREAIFLLRGGIELARREGDIATALRGAANVSFLVATYEGAPAAIDLTREALALARTIGDLGQTIWHLGNLSMGVAYAGLELQPILAELEEVLAQDLERGDRLQLMERLLIPSMLVGRDVSSELADWLTELKQRPDPQSLAAAEGLQAVWALVHGDFAAASMYAEREGDARPSDSTQQGQAAIYAAIAGDVERARAMLEKATAHRIPGVPGEGLRTASAAAIAALDGRRDEAIAGFREAARRLREIQDQVDLSLVALASIRTLGADVPEAVALAEEALAIYDRMGARPLAEIMRSELGRSQATATSEQRPVTSTEAAVEA